MTRALSLLLLTACSMPSFFASTTPSPPPVDLEASALQPGTAVTLTVSGLAGNSRAFYFVSLRGFGDGPCAPGSSTCLTIDRPNLIGVAATSTDTATLSINLPAAVAQGTEVWIQAAVASGGTFTLTDVERRVVGELACPVGLEPDCNDICRDEDLFGDGDCNSFLACPETQWDLGDCVAPDTGNPCPSGLRPDCTGLCRDDSLFGNGSCNSFLECADTNWDDGDCPIPDTGLPDCPNGLTRDCDGLCRDATLLGNNDCNSFLACVQTNWDDGDCPIPDTSVCPPGLQVDCSGLCRDEALFGDGTCNSFLECAETNWDDGDCPIPDTGNTCPSGLRPDCSGLCRDETLFGNNFCNIFLNCPETNFDEGDCP